MQTLQRSVTTRTIASTSPGMVNSFAEISTGRPYSRKVEEVTGPMDAIRIPSSPWRERS